MKLRQFLNELPETLDETYERILRGVNRAQKDDAHRLLQCLTVAVRPLRVEELAEILAFDFKSSKEGGIPKLKENWRWDGEAVLSTCSSLIAVTRTGDSRVVQLSHSSVKEYLTSPRLTGSHEDILQLNIDPEPAHTIMLHASLGTLLHLHDHADSKGVEGFPLVKYAAQPWVDHAQFKELSSRIRDRLYYLFDSSKPHFIEWRRRVRGMDEDWPGFTDWPRRLDHSGSPLYYAAFCGVHDLAEHLIMEHPEQVNAAGGRILAPLPAALYKGHFRIANLLHENGAVVDVQGQFTRTPLHTASMYGRVDITRWILDHGADANARKGDHWTPLHLAAHNMHPEVVQVLLEYGAESGINSQNDKDRTPLYEALFYPGTSLEVKVVFDVVRRLLEHGANPNIRDRSQSTPLHRASSKGWVEVARLLLGYGANVDERDEEGRTPFHVASSKGHHETTNLLLEHGAVP